MEEEKTGAPQGLVTHLPRSHVSGFEEASLAAKPVHMALPQSRATGAKLGFTPCGPWCLCPTATCCHPQPTYCPGRECLTPVYSQRSEILQGRGLIALFVLVTLSVWPC